VYANPCICQASACSHDEQVCRQRLLHLDSARLLLQQEDGEEEEEDEAEEEEQAPQPPPQQQQQQQYDSPMAIAEEEEVSCWAPGVVLGLKLNRVVLSGVSELRHVSRTSLC
jgi:hypothetical protein